MSAQSPIKTDASRMVWLPSSLGGLGLFSALFFGTTGLIVGLPLLAVGGAMGYRLHQRHERERFEHRALSVYRGIASGEVTREDLVRHMHYTPAEAEKVLTWLVAQNLMTVDYSADDDGMVYRLKVSGSGRPALPPAVGAGQGREAFDAQLEAAGAAATEQRELQALHAAAEARLKARRDREAAEELARQREAAEAARLAEEERRQAEEERRRAAQAAQKAFDERMAVTRKAENRPPVESRPPAERPARSDFDRAFLGDKKEAPSELDEFDKRFKKP